MVKQTIEYCDKHTDEPLRKSKFNSKFCRLCLDGKARGGQTTWKFN